MVSLELHKNGKCNTHPEYNLYTVKFTDVTEVEYSANIIAENMWAQCENVVNQVQLKGDNFKCRYDII